MPHFECGAFNHSATSPGAKTAMARRVAGEFYARMPIQTRRRTRFRVQNNQNGGLPGGF